MRVPRFYPILDTARNLPVGLQAAAIRHGGARCVQIRHKGLWTAELLDAAREANESIETLIVNDRADIAALTGAGLHIGQDDLPALDARRICPNAILGLSSHNEKQMIDAGAAPVDYVAIGPVFTTQSKQNPDAVVGLDLLRRIRLLTAKPLVAIGGITRQNAVAVLDAGADSVAVIADLYPEELSASSLEQRVTEWTRLLN